VIFAGKRADLICLWGTESILAAGGNNEELLWNLKCNGMWPFFCSFPLYNIGSLKPEETPLQAKLYAFEVTEHVKCCGYDEKSFLNDHSPTSSELKDLNFKFYSYGTVTGHQQQNNGTCKPILVMQFMPLNVMSDERRQDCERLSGYLDEVG
jgi:hypothetical protein